MNKGLIISNRLIGHNKYKIQRLFEEASFLNIALDVKYNDGSLSEISNDVISNALSEYNFVIYLDKDIYLAKQLEASGMRLFNKADFIRLCDDKILSNIALANKGIQLIDTISSPLVYENTIKDEYLSFIDYVSDRLKFPLVAKKVYGSLGEGVKLINNKKELKSFYLDNFKEPLLFSKYIKESYGKSIRSLIINGKYVGSIVRSNKNDFRSNYGTDTESYILENDEEIAKISNKIANILNVEYAGLDFLFGRDSYYFCEINSNAFFEEFEKVTKINVAKLVLEMIKEKINE